MRRNEYRIARHMSGSGQVDMVPVVNMSLRPSIAVTAACAMFAAHSPTPPASPHPQHSPRSGSASPAEPAAPAPQPQPQPQMQTETQTQPQAASSPQPPARPQSAAYRRGHELGKGGFGHVFAGERIPDGLPVALKIIKTHKVNTWASEVRLGLSTPLPHLHI